MTTDNPLLAITELPSFSRIKLEHLEPAIEQLIGDNLTALEDLLSDPAVVANPGWHNVIARLEDLDERLNNAWSVIGHLHNVQNTEPLRGIYDRCQERVSDYYTRLGQDERLYKIISSLAAKAAECHLTPSQQKVVEDYLLDFRLAGVHLDKERKDRFKTLEKTLNALSSRFGNNVLDSTKAWSRLLSNEQALRGLPPLAMEAAAAAAHRRGKQGYLVTLDFPSYNAVMTYADDRTLRKEVYDAYVTRASDQQPLYHAWDNQANILDILKARQEMAALLGFENYAEQSLAKKMAETPEEVLRFLEQLAQHSRPRALEEITALRQFAADLGEPDLQPWDVAYFSEKQRQALFDISQEELRQYFPLQRVRQGLFTIVSRLFGVDITPNPGYETWHESVESYDISRNGTLMARFFLDLFPREGKQGGAWMDNCRSRRKTETGRVHLPATYLVCNFSEPTESAPALLTHTEVLTLFHEFGHGLHHVLTQADELRVSGINGVAWDAVELPSQLMENWCWDPESIGLLSAHYQTGEPLPAALLERMLAARNYQAGIKMMRQLEFGLFDFRLHMLRDGLDRDTARKTIAQVRQQTSVVPVPDYNRFENSFSHIFAGGYAAGYYSYFWAEVLSADVFSRFEEAGVLNQEVGRQYLQKILSRGGTRKAKLLFEDFMGREPRIDALLRHRGLLAA
ncbi:MAG: hypothetical protein RLZZ385_731 [Pseudomonadota bacterium]|jgi:oligopeptidase A